MKDIQLTLTLEEVNTLLNALGAQPYNQIHLLIAKIQSQGSTQLQAIQNGQEDVFKTTETEKLEEVLTS